MEEQPYELPRNWVWTKLDDIVEFSQGIQVPIDKQSTEYKEGLTRFIRIIDYTQETDDIRYVLYTNQKSLVNIDDVVMIRYGTPGVVGRGIVGAIANNMFKINPICNSLNKSFLFYFFQDLRVYDEIKSKSSSTTMAATNFKTVSEINFPLPPLPEQQQIVAKIESLFFKIDKAKELIEEAREEFENRKSAILAKAFRGELTEKWREENIDIKSGEALFKDIEVLKEGLMAKEKNKVSSNVLDEPFKLPHTWIWTKLGNICYKFKYGTSKKSSSKGVIPVLRMGNLQGGKLDWSDLVYTSDEDEIKNYELLNNDILFNRTNSPELVGKTSIYKGEMKSIFAGYLIRIRPFELIDSDYINYFLNSTYAKYKCYQVKTDGVSQSNINSQKLGEFEIPLPPIEEQKEIVRILDNLLSFGSKIEELTNLEEQIELLKKSILAKAFRGKLGTNDPTEESAIELLKEVLSQKYK